MKKFKLTFYNPDRTIKSQNPEIHTRVTDFSHFGSGEVTIHFASGENKTVQLGSNTAMKVEMVPKPGE